jgi:hypothetical protein
MQSEEHKLVKIDYTRVNYAVRRIFDAHANFTIKYAQFETKCACFQISKHTRLFLLQIMRIFEIKIKTICTFTLVMRILKTNIRIFTVTKRL